jgi:GxxExxY protein
MLYPELSETVFDAVYEVHRELGPGLLELPYRNALYYALRERGCVVEMERPYVVSFHREVVGEYFADLVVERKVIIELKAVQRLGVDHEAQLMNYLRLSGCQLGFLFNLGRMKVQFKRMVLEWGRGEP